MHLILCTTQDFVPNIAYFWAEGDVNLPTNYPTTKLYTQLDVEIDVALQPL